MTPLETREQFLRLCRGGDLEKVNERWARSTQQSLTLTDDGMTLLHVAAEAGQVARCLSLVEKGAHIDALNRTKRTPLHLAAEKGHSETCQVLVQKGACLDAQAWWNSTPLHFAAQSGHSKTCQVLVENGADVAAQDCWKETPLHLAAERGYSETCQVLMESGPDVVALNNSMMTALHLAAVRGHSETCQVLVQKTASLDVQDQCKKTPLHLAAERGHRKTCQILVESGANVAAQDNLKKTPLHFAAERGHSKLCQLLVESGAHVDVQDDQGNTPADSARASGYFRLARMLPTFQLVRFGTMQPHCVVLRLAGPPGSGKSTLADTLCTGYWKRFFRWESQADTGTMNSHLRTKGMRCMAFLDEKASEFMIMDLGGHEEFFASHQAVMSFEDTPAINTIVLSSLMDREEMQSEAMRWASFYACRVHPDSALQPLIFIITREDKVTALQKRNMADVFGEVKSIYSSYFDLPCQPIFVDARKSRNTAMTGLRRKLSELWKKVLEDATPQPAVCQLIEDVLRGVSTLTNKPIITKDTFRKMIEESINDSKELQERYEVEAVKAVLTREILDRALMCLTRLGKVVSFVNPGLQDLLIILPSWLYIDLIGRLLSEPPLPPPYVRYVNGCAKREDVIDIFADVHPDITGEFVLKMLAERGLLVAHDDDEKVLALLKLTATRPLKLWPPVLAPARSEMIYIGRRKVYSQAAGVSLALFPVLQWRLYHLFLEEDGAVMPMWKDGIRIVSRRYTAEAILERHPEHRAVDVITRGTVAIDCQQLLFKLLVEVMALADELSPGSCLQHFYLSPRELATLPSLGSVAAPEVQYSQSRVEKASREATLVTDEVEKGFAPERLVDLFLLPGEVGGKRTSASAAQVDASEKATRLIAAVLHAISVQVPDRLTCIGLALKLNVQDDDLVPLEGKTDGHYSAGDCYGVLQSWWLTQPTGGRVTLYNALCSIGLVAVAKEHKAALCDDQDVGEGIVCREDNNSLPANRVGKMAAYHIAEQLATTHDCFSLGIELGVSRSSLDTLRGLTPAQYSNSFAYDMLCRWLRTAPENEGEQLYRALVACGKTNIAQEWKDLLLPSGQAAVIQRSTLSSHRQCAH